MNYTSIDWGLILDILKSISIIIASGVAIYGINSWRRETKWRRKYELAEDTLSLFYEVQDAIETIRSPISYSGEGKSRKQLDNEKPEDSDVLDMAYTVIERFEKNNGPFYKLRALKYRFITIFGVESEKPFNDIVKLTNKILSASNLLGNRYWIDQGRKKLSEKQSDHHLKKIQEFEDFIWDSYEEDDKVRTQLKTIINEIEKTCESVLKRK